MALEIFTKNANELIEWLGGPSARLPGGWGKNAIVPVDKGFFAADVRKTVERLVSVQGDIKGMFGRTGLVQVDGERIPATVADALRAKLREKVRSVEAADADRRQPFGKMIHRILSGGLSPSAAFDLLVDVKPAHPPARDVAPRESPVGDFPRYALAGLPAVKAEAARNDTDKYSLPKSYGLGLYLAAAVVAATGTFMLLFFVK